MTIQNSKIQTSFLYYLLLIYFQLSKCQVEDIQFVYSQLPRKQIDIIPGQFETSTCEDRSISQNLIFLCKGNNSIIVFDENSKNLIQEYEFDKQITSISVMKDGINILIGNDKLMYLYSFMKENQKFNLLRKNPAITFYTTIQKVIFNRIGNLTYAFGAGGYITAYKVNKTYDFIEISQPYITQSNLIHSGQLLKDEQFLLLADDQNGLIILSINKKKDDENQIYFTLAANNLTMGWIYDFVMKDDYSIIFCFNVWRGLQIIKFLEMQEQLKKQNYPFIIPYQQIDWPQNYLSPNIYSGQLSSDEKFIFLGVRSHGIIILDIKNYQKPKILQQVYVVGHALLLHITQSQKYIIFSNAIKFNIYERIAPNLNADFPNFFNMHQSVSIDVHQSEPFKWRCYIKEDTSKNKNKNLWYTYLAFDAISTAISIQRINEISYKIQELWTINFSDNSYVDSFEFSENGDLLYLPVQEPTNRALDVYNITNRKEPKYIASLIDDQKTYHSEQIYASKDNQYFVMSYDSFIILVENKDKSGKNMTIVVRHQFSIHGSCVGAYVTKDYKYLIGAIRDYGLVVVDISDKQNTFETDILQTHGAESLFPSKFYDIVYVADGMRGFKILDLNALPKIKVLGQYQLPGWTNQLELTHDENYLIVSSMDYGMITLFDISDKNHPVFLQKVQILMENAQATCIQKDLIFGFILNQNAIRMLPLKSQVILNTEIALINAQGELQPTEKKSFLIGQQILIQFTPLYINQNGKIKSVKLYSKILGTKSDLPPTMKFQENGDIIFKIDKESIYEENNSSPLSTVTLIAEVQTQIQSTSFLMTESDDQVYNAMSQEKQIELSNKIFFFLNEKGCLDNQNYLQDICKGNIIIPSSITKIETYIEFVLNKLAYCYFYNPIIIRIKSSLQFDQKNLKNMVVSLSEKIVLLLTLDEDTKSKFILKFYDNLIISYNNDFTQLRIEGSLSAVNRALSNKIVIHNQNSNEKIKLQLYDSINYELTIQLTIKDSLFVEIKKPLTVQNSIQKQINNLYKDSEIYVFESFSFNIDKNTFYDQDNLKITYTAYYWQKDSYISLDQSSWVKFDQDNLKIYGKPPQSSLFSTTYLKIIADNQSSKAEEEFYLKVSKISFEFVLQVLLQILGPLAFIFSIYNYRINFFNALYRNRTIYSTETAYVGKLYSKKILLVGQNMKIAKQFFDTFLKELKKEQQSKSQKIKIEVVSKSFFLQQNSTKYNDNEQKLQSPFQLKLGLNCNNRNQDLNQTEKLEISLSQVIKQNIESEQYLKQDKFQILQNGEAFNLENNLTLQNNQYNQASLQKINSNFNFQQTLGSISKVDDISYIHGNINQHTINNLNCHTINNLNNNLNTNNIFNTQNNITINNNQQTNNNILNTVNNSFNNNYNNLNLNINNLNNFNLNTTNNNYSNSAQRNNNVNNISNYCYQKQNVTINTDFNKDSFNILKIMNQHPNLDIQNEKMLLSNLLSITLDGMSIRFDSMLEKMIDLNLSFRKKFLKYRIHEYQEKLLNQNSFFHMCIKTCAIKFLLSQDKKLQILLNYMQSYSLKYFKLTKNDWYKAYLEIHGQNIFNSDDQLILFPQISLKTTVILLLFQQLNLIEATCFDITQVSKIGINFALFKECLIVEALGLDNQNCGFMKKCSGESIHARHELLFSIEAFSQNKSKRCNKISKWLNTDYKRLPISQNMSLPSWISYDFKQGVLILEGIPLMQDQDRILIRIFDSNHYILLQYNLNIIVDHQCNMTSSKQEMIFSPVDQSINQEQMLQNQQQQLLNSIDKNEAVQFSRDNLFGNYSSGIRLNQNQKIRKETFFKKQHLIKLISASPELRPTIDSKKYDQESNKINIIQQSKSIVSSQDVQDSLSNSKIELQMIQENSFEQSNIIQPLNVAPQFQFIDKLDQQQIK